MSLASLTVITSQRGRDTGTRALASVTRTGGLMASSLEVSCETISLAEAGDTSLVEQRMVSGSQTTESEGTLSLETTETFHLT